MLRLILTTSGVLLGHAITVSPTRSPVVAPTSLPSATPSLAAPTAPTIIAPTPPTVPSAAPSRAPTDPMSPTPPTNPIVPTYSFPSSSPSVSATTAPTIIAPTPPTSPTPPTNPIAPTYSFPSSSPTLSPSTIPTTTHPTRLPTAPTSPTNPTSRPTWYPSTAPTTPTAPTITPPTPNPTYSFPSSSPSANAPTTITAPTSPTPPTSPTYSFPSSSPSVMVTPTSSPIPSAPTVSAAPTLPTTPTLFNTPTASPSLRAPSPPTAIPTSPTLAPTPPTTIMSTTLAPSPAFTSYPNNTVTTLTIEVNFDVVATCEELSVLAENLRSEMAASLGLSLGSITITVSGCSQPAGRRLLAATTLTIVLTTNAGNVQASSSAAQTFLRSPDFGNVVTNSSLTLNGEVKVSPTSVAVNACGGSFLSFTVACHCPTSMLALTQCPDLCVYYERGGCKVAVTDLANCTTDAGLGALIRAVRAGVSGDRCAPVVSEAFAQASLYSFFAAALFVL